jgi:hypothetical protein
MGARRERFERPAIGLVKAERHHICSRMTYCNNLHPAEIE